MQSETDLFLRTQRAKMLKRLEAGDIPDGVLPKIMNTWMEIENHLADMMQVKARKNG